ncbi:sulfatase-like hydrolase/transferase [Algibacter sp. 2305UL17-15]|uniref:sulfatase-like hydrolase/transferase n=1 Tax=Algibacter sp. 2305UL17-15 TaxID=3231268 RepID=UPI003457A4D4
MLRFNLFASGVVAFEDYKNYKNLLRDNLSKPNSDNLKLKDSSFNNQTCVVIIGESTTRWHMQLYGYDRPTNPKLKELKDELYIFSDVIAPNVHTILSLDKILTFSDYSNSNKENNASVVQLANMAGFETYWLSNQQAIGLHESVSTLLGLSAKNQYFFAGDDNSAISYDEVIFGKLEEILNDEVERKVVFIHLMGTHSRYNYRYPKNYSIFTQDDYQDASLFKKSRQKKIDYYDNAVLYNDFVVRNIIDMVDKTGDNSSVIYFSDHGDDLYDTSFDIVGHDEYHGTRPMYEVPFLLWLSSKHFLKKNDGELREYVNRKYILEDFEHTFADLLGVTHNLYEPNKSIINSNFKEKTRLVKNGIDYDKQED